MARINVEESAWKKFYRVAEFMKWDLRIAAGAVLGLWHESQEKSRLSAEPKEICRWSRVEDPAERPKYIEALIEADLIRPLATGSTWDQGDYAIAGNEDEVIRIVKLKQRSKKGGEATKRKWDAEAGRTARLKEGHKPTVSPPQPGLSQACVTLVPGTVQFSSDQCSSDQNNKNQEGAVEAFEPKSRDPLRPEIRECCDRWLKVLEHFKASRPLMPAEETVIGRQVQARGKEAVLLAFLGAENEPAGETFKPAAHLSLQRIFDPQKFERFVNLGAQARVKLQADEAGIALLHPAAVATRTQLEIEAFPPVIQDMIDAGTLCKHAGAPGRCPMCNAPEPAPDPTDESDWNEDAVRAECDRVLGLEGA